MEMIKRPRYMQFLESFQDSEPVKVLTGIRRSGKTYLMKMFIDHLQRTGVGRDQIVHVNFEDFAFADLRTARDLYDYVHVHQHRTKRTYLFFDEIQHVAEWQRAVNSFRVDMDADIYITGSNAYLLSGELATLLTGRYVELPVFPLSFKEYYDFKGGQREGAYQLLQDYLANGGFPAVALAQSQPLKVALKNGIYDSILLSDIALRAQTRNDQALVALCDYLMSEVGNLLSATKISNAMRATGYRIAPATVINYLQLLEQSFLFYRARRYDLRGKKLLSTQDKYYVVDNGLRNTRLHRAPTDNFGHQLENLVYLELLRRGCAVDVGKLGEREIDFVARKGEQAVYYQVTQRIPENSTRETDNLKKIPDGYQKVLLTLDQLATGNVDGIRVESLLDWLLQEDEGDHHAEI